MWSTTRWNIIQPQKHRRATRWTNLANAFAKERSPLQKGVLPDFIHMKIQDGETDSGGEDGGLGRDSAKYKVPFFLR